MSIFTTTVILDNVPLQVSYYYTPAEPPEIGPDAQYPGCDEVFEIEEVLLQCNNIDIAAWLSKEMLTTIETVIQEQRHEEY